jgi:hypothetical protein
MGDDPLELEEDRGKVEEAVYNDDDVHLNKVKEAVYNDHIHLNTNNKVSDLETDDIQSKSISEIVIDEMGSKPEDLLNSGEDIVCLSDLGVVQHSHELLEDKITRRIELNSDLAGIQKELDILFKRKNKKELELDQIYSANLHGRHKRKIQALLSEQEKLNSKIEELQTEEKSVVDQLNNGGDQLAATNVEASGSGRSILKNLLSENPTEEQVKLGVITSFGSSVESTQVRQINLNSQILHNFCL